VRLLAPRRAPQVLLVEALVVAGAHEAVHPPEGQHGEEVAVGLRAELPVDVVQVGRPRLVVLVDHLQSKREAGRKRVHGEHRHGDADGLRVAREDQQRAQTQRVRQQRGQPEHEQARVAASAPPNSSSAASCGTR
jgi:hypothetical protein